MKYVLALDQGTTSCRSILFDRDGKIVDSSQLDFEQIFPKPGWVEHDPMEIWNSQKQTIDKLLERQKGEIAAIGITNQRETTIIWDRESGEPIYNAIVWQDRRTAAVCNSLKTQGLEKLFKSKTGLIIDAYFSGTKIKWLLDNVEGAREKAERGELCFGTVDSWLIYKLTNGKLHITDVTNASRTLLFNIHSLKWDEELLNILDIPASLLPEVKESSSVFARTDASLFGEEIPISGIAGDQQAALFGQMCIKKGMAKNTYGTGCFLLMNTGGQPIESNNNLLTTIAWSIDGKVSYALEGSVFVGGAAVQWVRDGLGLVKDAAEIEKLAISVEDNGGVVFVPALTGMGAPYWDPYARGSIFGLTRGTTAAHIARATLEGIAFQVYDLIKSMEEDSSEKCTELRVDGGASANNFLMQFQSDIFNFDVVRSEIQETTALGAAYLAGLAVGFWDNLSELEEKWNVDASFSPKMPEAQKKKMINNWHKAIERSKNWIED